MSAKDIAVVCPSSLALLFGDLIDFSKEGFLTHDYRSEYQISKFDK